MEGGQNIVKDTVQTTTKKKIVLRKAKYDQDFIKRSTGEKVFNVCNLLLMALLLVFLLYPVLNVLAISVSSEREVMAANVTFYPIGSILRRIPPSLRIRSCGVPSSTVQLWLSAAAH